MDAVLGVYKANSLKANTRKGRGGGKVLRVSEKHKWKNFLCVDSNKTKSESTSPGKILVTLKSQNVASSTTLDVSCLQPCLHEEADYRMMLHCFYAYSNSMKRIMVFTTDTNILVLAIVTWKIVKIG